MLFLCNLHCWECNLPHLLQFMSPNSPLIYGYAQCYHKIIFYMKACRLFPLVCNVIITGRCEWPVYASSVTLTCMHICIHVLPHVLTSVYTHTDVHHCSKIASVHLCVCNGRSIDLESVSCALLLLHCAIVRHYGPWCLYHSWFTQYDAYLPTVSPQGVPQVSCSLSTMSRASGEREGMCSNQSCTVITHSAVQGCTP